MAIADTNTDVDLKITTITDTIDTLHDTVTSNIVLLRSDVLDKINLVYSHVNDSIASARSKWQTNITESSLFTRSVLDSPTRSIQSHLHDKTLKLDTLSNTLHDKITTIETLSVSDPQVQNLLNGATLDHVCSLVLSPAVDEIISNAVATKIAPLTNDVTTLKNSTSSSIIHPKPKLGFAQVESKDFCVSKFTKELERIHLQGNTLKDLELF